MNVVNTRIQQRYDTLQNWQQRNPVLLDGELAVVATDNQTRFKIGDGEHAFNDLNFIDQLKLTTVSAYANVLSSNMAAIGFENIVGTHSLAAGTNTSAATQHAVALGYKAATSSNGAFVFNGDQNYIASPYYDHGVGTFNVNAPLSDIYVQQSAFSDILSDKADKTTLDAKITIDDQISGICAQTDLSIVKLSANDYAYLVATSATLSNCLYIVEDDIINACGQQISNLAPGTGLSDAVNLEQLNDAVNSIQIPTDLSAFTNSPGYLVSNDISDYYKKSETSSSSQISNELKKYQLSGNYLSANALVNYYTKSETSSANEISSELKKYQLSGNYLSTNALDNYYQKSETSSAAEISTALANAGGGSGQLSTKLDINAAWPAWTSNGEYDWRQIVSHNGKLWKASEPFPSIEPGTGIGWVSVDINSILTANYQPKGNYLTAVPTTYKTYSQTIAALSSDGYATSTQVNQKSTVSFNQITTTGTNIGSITIDGTTTQIYAPNSGGGGGSGSTVEVSADYQSGTKIATISVDSVPTSIYIPNSSTGSTRYALATATLQTAGNSLSCAVDDQTITTIQVSSSSTPIIVQLPAQPADGARDFILRIEISSSTAPTFTFNGVNETIDFDSEDDDWAVMEPGLNLVSFTETKRGN